MSLHLHLRRSPIQGRKDAARETQPSPTGDIADSRISAPPASAGGAGGGDDEDNEDRRKRQLERDQRLDAEKVETEVRKKIMAEAQDRVVAEKMQAIEEIDAKKRELEEESQKREQQFAEMKRELDEQIKAAHARLG